MNKQEFIEQFINANNNEERIEITKEAFEALECEFYEFDDLLEYVEETLEMITSHSNEELNYFAQLILENLTSLTHRPEKIDVVLLIPNLPAFKAEIPNNYEYLRDFVSVQSNDNSSNAIEFVEDSVKHPFSKKLFSICLHENGKFNGSEPNRHLFLDQEFFFRTDLLFGPAIVTSHNWMGESMSLLKEDIEMIIAEFNRPERVATGRETPENYLGFEIIAMDR